MGSSVSYYGPVTVYFIVGSSVTWIVDRIYNKAYNNNNYYYFYIGSIKQIG